MSQVRLDEAISGKGYESRDIWIRKVITRCEVPGSVQGKTMRRRYLVMSLSCNLSATRLEDVVTSQIGVY